MSVQVYLDTNVFIEMFEKKTAASSLIWALFDRAEQSNIHFISSELTLAELLVDPIKEAHCTGNWQPVYDYREVVTDKEAFQTIIPVTRKILDSAANIRALNKSVKLPDAIHLATAIETSCYFFLSNDIALSKLGENKNAQFPIKRFVTFEMIATESFMSTDQ
jgi:predicted nucleic acid-binding protein